MNPHTNPGNGPSPERVAPIDGTFSIAGGILRSRSRRWRRAWLGASSFLELRRRFGAEGARGGSYARSSSFGWRAAPFALFEGSRGAVTPARSESAVAPAGGGTSSGWQPLGARMAPAEAVGRVELAAAAITAVAEGATLTPSTEIRVADDATRHANVDSPGTRGGSIEHGIKLEERTTISPKLAATAPAWVLLHGVYGARERTVPASPPGPAARIMTMPASAKAKAAPVISTTLNTQRTIVSALLGLRGRLPAVRFAATAMGAVPFGARWLAHAAPSFVPEAARAFTEPAAASPVPLVHDVPLVHAGPAHGPTQRLAAAIPTPSVAERASAPPDAADRPFVHRRDGQRPAMPIDGLEDVAGSLRTLVIREVAEQLARMPARPTPAPAPPPAPAVRPRSPQREHENARQILERIRTLAHEERFRGGLLR